MLFLLFIIIFQSWIANIKAQKFRMDYMWAQPLQTFYSLHDMATDWDTAVQICEAEGTALLKPDSLAELDNLKVLMSNMRSHYTAVFIGLHDKYSDGDFVSLKGEWLALILEFFGCPKAFDLHDFCLTTAAGTNCLTCPPKHGEPIAGSILDLLWAPGSPNNATENSTEHCVVMSREGMFDDQPCQLIYPFICKIEVTDTHYNEPCDNYDMDFKLYETGKCYKYHLEPLSWHAAYMICNVQEGSLAIINSEEEASLIAGFMAKYLINKAPDPNILHIGFSDLMFQYEYRTIKGQTLEESNFTKWAPIDKNTPEMAQKRCGALSRTGELLMTWCDMPAMFICEKVINIANNKPEAKLINNETIKNNVSVENDKKQNKLNSEPE